MYHTTLLVYLLWIECQTRRPIAQYQQTRVERTLSSSGHIVNVVNCLVNGCVSIEVASKLHTNGTQVLYQVVAFEVVAAIERHVLQEMRQSSLTFFLLNGPHLLCNVKVCTVFGPVVVANKVSETIVKLTHSHGSVYWYGRHLHLGMQHTCTQQKQSTKKMSDFHR